MGFSVRHYLAILVFMGEVLREIVNYRLERKQLAASQNKNSSSSKAIGYNRPQRGLFESKNNKNGLKVQIVFFVIVYVIHFAFMPLSYYLVKRYYPFRRHYAPGERVVIDIVPLGNIFVNAYHLRAEKRIVWNAAKKTTGQYDKVIVLSDNTNSTPYSYFLDLGGSELKETLGPEIRWAGDHKEYILIDIINEYDREALRQYLTTPEYANFSVHFPPFIPERVPRIYQEVTALLAESGRQLLK